VSRPGLWERLRGSARVTVLSAPPGSGKTVLLRSWISQTGLGDAPRGCSWGATSVMRRFWLSVLGALRQTIPGSALAVERARALGLLAPSAHP
jgi:LuxR family transcriptional regulator, maltose regulon positive regulatory protein